MYNNEELYVVVCLVLPVDNSEQVNTNNRIIDIVEKEKIFSAFTGNTSAFKLSN